MAGAYPGAARAREPSSSRSRGRGDRFRRRSIAAALLDEQIGRRGQGTRLRRGGLQALRHLRLSHGPDTRDRRGARLRVDEAGFERRCRRAARAASSTARARRRSPTVPGSPTQLGADQVPRLRRRPRAAQGAWRCSPRDKRSSGGPWRGRRGDRRRARRSTARGRADRRHRDDRVAEDGLDRTRLQAPVGDAHRPLRRGRRGELGVGDAVELTVDAERRDASAPTTRRRICCTGRSSQVLGDARDAEGLAGGARPPALRLRPLRRRSPTRRSSESRIW